MSRIGPTNLSEGRIVSSNREYVILTGAGGGIGRGIVQHLTDQGLGVLGIDISNEAVEAASSAASSNGVFEGAVADISDFSAAAATCAKLVNHRIRGVVNCAGVFVGQEFEEITEKDWLPIITSNLVTTISMCRAVLPVLREQSYGSVVNFASTAGEYGSIRPAALYAAAKGGVIALTKSLAREYGQFGVRVNAVSPGPTDTVGFRPTGNSAKSDASARTLLGRMGAPADQAFAVGFLLDPGTSWITGEVLRVNGGSLI
jgi:NAD(P)-dependent dehydrogenase (short-subunit alcohol dehydrogenase family)